MEFRKLTNPQNEWKWWAMCPDTNEPILLRTVKGMDDIERIELEN